MKKIINKRAQINGMALGGLGAGSVEINENGILQNWDIFNLGKWASRDAEKNKKDDLYDYQRNVMPFTIRTQQGNDVPKVRKLFHDSDSGEFRSLMYSWHKEVKAIEWNPSFPSCELKYIDETLPVTVKSEFSSAFIPLDAKTSGTPGFFVTFTIENTSFEHIEVSLMGKIKNPINRGAKNRQLKNTVSKTWENLAITMSSSSKSERPQNGNLCVSIIGDGLSYIQSDFAAYFQNYVQGGDFGVTEQSYLFGFRENGRLPNCGLETIPTNIMNMSNAMIEKMTSQELIDTLEQLLKLASASSPFDRIQKIDPTLLASDENKIKFICMIKDKMNELAFDSQKKEAWGDAALCSTMKLHPGQKKQVKFFVSWYFPNHCSDNGNFVGHMYTNWFTDAKMVNEFMTNNYKAITASTSEFASVLRKATAPASFIDNWCNHLNTLIKCSWWSKIGDFAIWEGYGSCGFHTMDITYQGSFSLLALFPELQMSQMKLGATFQRDDGRVHHFFTPDFKSVDDGFDRVDMNPQFVLLVCRDYLWTGNLDYVKHLWEPIVKAMNSIEQLDANGDGLPDQETSTNTYDAWHFKGTPSYISSLWLAALLAAIRLADDLGEIELSIRWKSILKKGKKSFIKTLWNKSYFSLWVDEQTRDECCMADQIDGHWYSELIGLGNFLPSSMVESALESIWEFNYHEETGLINAIYPPSSTPTLYTYNNVQALANWSGVEYAFVSALLERKMVGKSIKLSNNVEHRYYDAGRIFNHEECGDHYYRALSSWTILLSATGFKLDVPLKTVTIVPPIDGLQSPWFSPTGYGYFEKKLTEFHITCSKGHLVFKKLALDKGVRAKTVMIDGVDVPFEAKIHHGTLSIRFDKTIVLLAGSTIEIK